MRRFVTANGCTRLATLTYGGADRPRDRRVVARDVAVFVRRLKERYPQAWVRVFELHKDGVFHVHLALSRYVPQKALERLWGHGFVHVEKIRTKRGGREDARQAARYLAKYIGKEMVAAPGEHAYEVAQGYQPPAVERWCWSREDALRAAVAVMDGELPGYVWDSDGQAADWRGPPVTFAGW